MIKIPLGPVGYPLPKYADGGYPIVYLDDHDRVLCPDCANDPDCSYGPAVIADIHWEGIPMACEGCIADIASAYGPVDPDCAFEE
jgi:hypothetical protein